MTAYKALHLLTSSPPLPLTHSPPATMAFFLLLEHTQALFYLRGFAQAVPSFVDTCITPYLTTCESLL